MNRGARRQAIFRSAADSRSFLALLEEAHHRYGLEVHAFCLMGNHFHLLVRSVHGNLADAMRHIEGVHAARFNDHHELDGPLFKGRYTVLLVDTDEYLLTVSRYIHLNPVEASIVTAHHRPPDRAFKRHAGSPLCVGHVARASTRFPDPRGSQASQHSPVHGPQK